jgi:hypothetical protein
MTTTPKYIALLNEKAPGTCGKLILPKVRRSLAKGRSKSLKKSSTLTQNYYGTFSEHPGYFSSSFLESQTNSEEVDFSIREKIRIFLALIPAVFFYRGFGCLFLIRDLRFLKVKNVDFRGASSPHSLGKISIGERFFELSHFEQSQSLVHELAHQELFLVNFTDKLVTKNETRFAPFQGRPRPTIARIHALFALWRMIQFQSACRGSSDKATKQKFETTKATLTSQELSSVGAALVKSLTISTP